MWPEIVTRLHLNPGNDLAVGGGTLAMILTCLFCWIRGDRSDRIGAVVFAACWMVTLAVEVRILWVTGNQRPPFLLDVVCDTVPGLTFLWLAIRRDNLWFGAVALFLGVQFALDAADQAIHEPIGTLLPLALILPMNLLNFAMMAAMIGSVVSRGRRATASQQG
jgi:hypothetical protein